MLADAFKMLMDFYIIFLNYNQHIRLISIIKWTESISLWGCSLNSPVFNMDIIRTSAYLHRERKLQPNEEKQMCSLILKQPMNYKCGIMMTT